MPDHDTTAGSIGPSTDREYELKTQAMNKTSRPRESHMIHELKDRREYLFRQLMDVQKAIDAVNSVSSLY